MIWISSAWRPNSVCLVLIGRGGSTCVAENPPASPLEYTVSVVSPQEMPLDEVVVCSREVKGQKDVRFWGVVDSTEWSTTYTALVKVVRIHPEVLVPPEPGEVVTRCNEEHINWALRFHEMARKLPAGLLANGLPAYFNLDFLNGEKGAHLNIAGISGVATKTSYALFLLYSLFHAHPASRAIIFNVKGDDLCYLDRPNAKLTDQDREQYQQLGLPAAPFPEVAYHAAPLQTMRQFAERELIRFLFTEPERSGAIAVAVDQLAWTLKTEAAKTQGPDLVLQQKTVTTFDQLADQICADDGDNIWLEKLHVNTRQLVIRRLRGITPQVNNLLGPTGHFNYDRQLNVVDLHALSEKARAFVVGLVLKSVFDNRETQGPDHPTVYIVLDELNKYAPRESSGPIGQMLLDIAERGRSLGIVLVGAEQTASAVEERVVGNAALRVVGRLEAGESFKDAYTWLSPGLRRRATLLQPGHMMISQPQVPVPLVVKFPFPAWATRRAEVP